MGNLEREEECVMWERLPMMDNDEWSEEERYGKQVTGFHRMYIP